MVRSAELSGKVPPAYAPAYLVLANIAQREGNGELAVQNFTRALFADPTQPGPFRQLAGILLQLERGEQALAMCQQLVEASPGILEFPIMCGELLAELGKSDEAIRHFERLVENVPLHPAPHYSLALNYRKQQQFDKAKKQLEVALTLNPAYEAAYLMQLDIARTEGETAAAFDIVHRALEHVPDSVLINNSLAWMLATSSEAARRDPEKAVQLAEKIAAATERTLANYLDTLACAYAAAGRFDDAVRVEKEALVKAKERDQHDLVAEFEGRLALFESGQAYVEAP
jgi:tetratricopeptide (TPR) repeat protein